MSTTASPTHADQLNKLLDQNPNRAVLRIRVTLSGPDDPNNHSVVRAAVAIGDDTALLVEYRQWTNHRSELEIWDSNRRSTDFEDYARIYFLPVLGYDDSQERLVMAHATGGGRSHEIPPADLRVMLLIDRLIGRLQGQQTRLKGEPWTQHGVLIRRLVGFHKEQLRTWNQTGYPV
jgi:hypothetical protein